MYIDEIFACVAIAVIAILVLSLIVLFIAKTEQTTMSANNQKDTIISESADTREEEAQIVSKQDSDQTKEISNHTYITNNYTYNSTGGDFFSDLSINVVAEIIAAFILGFLGNKVYSKFKKKV